jgi:hypothetical protein
MNRASALLAALFAASPCAAFELISPPLDPPSTHLCRAAIAQAEQEFGIPRGLLAAIGRVESGRRDPDSGDIGPWPWAVNNAGDGRYFRTREQAITHVGLLQARGERNIDVGCTQVNLMFHPYAFISIEEAFEPLANARYAARFLANLAGRTGDWTNAAGFYHSATPARFQPYRARVLAIWSIEANREAPPLPTEEAPPEPRVIRLLPTDQAAAPVLPRVIGPEPD